MISDKEAPRVIEDVSENLLAAVTIIQLGIPKVPDESWISSLAAKHNDARHRQVTLLLHNANLTGLDEKTVIQFSSLIHLSCEWAWGYRQSSKTSITKTTSGRYIRSRYRNSSSSRELRRLAEASRMNDELYLAKAIVDLSPHTFTELRLAAKELGIKFLGPASLLCGECISRTTVLALANLSSGRPRLREMDRAARAVKLAYQNLTGRTGSGRGIASTASTEAGRPTGELHSLLLHIGSLYDIKLVTAASDDRMRMR